MSGDGVHASPESVKRLAAALGRYQEEVSSAGKRVQNALDAANWHDQQKDQFEARYKDLQRTLDHFISSEVQAMVKSLGEFARRLDEIRSLRM